MERIAIIGGGASALMCACFCSADVTIFEKQEKFGKKNFGNWEWKMQYNK